MASDPVDVHRLTLTVQRLLDADVVLPEEANALVAEIEAYARSPGGRKAHRAAVESDVPSEKLEPHFQSLEALVRTDRLGASAGGKAREIVRRILHGDDPA